MCHIKNIHVPVGTVKCRLYEELWCIFSKFNSYHMKVLLGSHIAKSLQKDIFTSVLLWILVTMTMIRLAAMMMVIIIYGIIWYILSHPKIIFLKEQFHFVFIKLLMEWHICQNIWIFTYREADFVIDHISAFESMTDLLVKIMAKAHMQYKQIFF
jgi:hypothetical protein